MNKSVSGNYFNYLSLLLLSALLLVTPEILMSQGNLNAEVRNTNCPVANHEADRWFFGQNAGLDFRTDVPEVDPSNYRMNVPTSTAIISDSNGNIRFYSDGIKVYNRYHDLMPNGDGLHGFVGYSMPVLIVPKPGSDSIYYIFTTHRPKQNDIDPQVVYGLEYNEVNMNRDNGRGDITRKNKVLLQPEVSSKLSAVKHSNGVDYWLVAHKFNSNEFCSFRVTANGVDTNNYVSSNVGSVHTAPGETNNGIGFMKISPDGTKLALAIHGSEIYEIFNFDASTGQVSNAVTSPPVFKDAYGIEFSSDSRFFYGTATPTEYPDLSDTIPEFSCLLQFDVSLGNSIFSSYDTIAKDTLGSYFGGMQLATDGKIYVSRSPFGNAALSVIQNPKRPGMACNFTVNALDLQGMKSRYGFPNFVQTFFDLPHFDVENVCYKDETVFILQNNSNIDTYSWQFVDPGNPGTSSAAQPTHEFSGPGSYDVQITEYFGGIAYGPYTETVLVNELPAVDIGDTVYMYPGSPILLDAGEGWESYEWSTTENTQIIRVDKPGTYSVTVQNERCCFNSDSTLVIYFDVMVPNAFRPGGTNDIFRAYASSLEAINNFTMYIYNRWGQQIFVSHDINEGWDGTIDGKDAPGDVYVWLINYDVEREGKAEKIAYKGNVLLLR
ncbi:MAG: gliding motility-associated C-terminal domain-containing protein [Bacteroidales bacterium]|nr:gliding motility-associated C-terminal domain-containing protein [Bacteroidales bacterium]